MVNHALLITILRISFKQELYFIINESRGLEPTRDWELTMVTSERDETGSSDNLIEYMDNIFLGCQPTVEIDIDL